MAKTRIPALDGLRGCAIILVIFFHANVWFGGEFGGRGGILSTVFGAGWIGVDLFFVLSGFLITRLLLQDKDQGSTRAYFGGFYGRRALRILPLYYGFLLLYLVLPRSPAFGNDGYSVPTGDEVSLILFYYNFLAGLCHRVVPTLHAFWSLGVEEHFYFAWPWLVWFLSERVLGRCCLALAALSLGLRLAVIHFGAPIQTAYLLTPCRLDGLAIGAFLAVAERRPDSWAAVRRWAPYLAAAAAFAFLALGAAQGHFKDNVDFRYSHPPVRRDSSLIVGFGISAAAAFFAALLALAVSGGPLARLFAWAPLRSIGKYSYAMYVFHRLLFHVSSYFLVRLFPNYDQLAPLIGKPLGGLWLLGLSFAAAWLSYRYYERRFLALRPGHQASA